MQLPPANHGGISTVIGTRTNSPPAKSVAWPIVTFSQSGVTLRTLGFNSCRCGPRACKNNSAFAPSRLLTGPKFNTL